MKSVPWTKYDVGNTSGRIYMNLQAVRFDYLGDYCDMCNKGNGSTCPMVVPGDTMTVKWDDIDTSADPLSSTDLGDCKDEADGIKASQIIGTVTNLPAINLAFTRGILQCTSSLADPL